MTEAERLAIKQKLKDDFPHYAAKCLKIRTKAGSVEGLTLNKAQSYIHQRLELQREHTGKVRALILKGRQQGCCYAPNLKVLTSDYRWVKLADIQVGEKLWAVDEYGLFNAASGRKIERRIRVADVEAKAYLEAETFEIILSNGVVLQVTGEHRHLCLQRGGCTPEWRTINDSKVGDHIRAFCSPPDNHEPGFEDGWFGGLLDGEGTFGAYPAARIGVSQVDGAVLRRVKRYLSNKNIKYYELIDERTSAGPYTKFGDKFVHCIRVDRQADILKVLSCTRPSRFVDKPVFENKKLPKSCPGFEAWPEIVSIRSQGIQKVIDLQTSTKTFICEGLVSHNSTYVGARFYHQVTHRFGCQAFILTHALDATQNLYQMAKRFFEHTPDVVRPAVSKSNAKELIFGILDSGYKLGTAENKNVGRSSTIQLFHGSECAFWNNAAELATGILQAIPNTPNTEVILESTANGVGNFFHQKWQEAESGLSDFIAIFVPWYWQPEYSTPLKPGFVATVYEEELITYYGLTFEQLNWRRGKIQELSVNGMDGDKGFCQEYPMNATEAFVLTGEDNYIASDIVMRARKTTGVEPYGPLLLGVDPARFGDDRTAIIRRRGRCAFGMETHIKKDTMEIAGLVYSIYKKELPTRIYVDVGGLGAGVVDRLNELGLSDIVVAVNAGAKPLDAERYRNKRSEMWGSLLEWLNDEPAILPDSDELQADLCNIKYQVDSNSRLVMEAKEHMKKRGVRSCDTADAICLTFANPNPNLDIQLSKQRDNILQSMADDFTKKFSAINKSRGQR